MHDSICRRLAHPGLGFGLAVLLLAQSGCALFSSSQSFSDSSGSISDSVGSSSDSSQSSSDGDDDEAYHQDVRAYTVAHVRAERRPATLSLGLSEVALARGISDWEAFPTTFDAIGVGLAEAGVDEERLKIFRTVLAGSDPAAAAALEQGYRGAPR